MTLETNNMETLNAMGEIKKMLKETLNLETLGIGSKHVDQTRNKRIR